MRRLLLIAFLALLSNFGQGQTTGAGFIIYVGSAPSGTCSAGAYQENVIGLGTVYSCQSGTWTQVGSGVGSVTSIATTSPITGGTITGTGTIACATCTTTVASGTSALATGAISSATCATVVTTAGTGIATTDVVTAGFNGDPTAVTGYVPLTTGMLTIIAYPSSGNVNFKVCNNTSASITPGAITLNWRVVR